jgi:DNA-binding transcriptional regulator YhcF (GntR family)
LLLLIHSSDLSKASPNQPRQTDENRRALARSACDILRGMRLWLSRSSEVPLREQLVTQIRLGIVSGDLRVRQKLPSTRELARRFQIHANTVSAAYRELHRGGWVDFRKGSGVYVRGRSTNQRLEDSIGLDQTIRNFFQTARARGHSLREIQSRLQHWLTLQPPDHFLIIEPDVELRCILMTEIQEATGARVAGTSLADLVLPEMLTGAAPVAMYSQAESIRAALPPDADLITLRSRSVPESLLGQTRPSADALVAIVSRWPEFLRWAHTILIAAGLDPDALSFRDARRRGWEKGLRSTGLVITDSLMARQLPASVNVRLFRIVSDSSLDELRAFVERFFK